MVEILVSRIFVPGENVSLLIHVLMKIYFNHNGKTCTAELYYNFREVDDCALLVFKDCFTDDILFSKINGVWASVSDLQTRFPKTYSNIQEAVFAAFYKD